MRDREICAKCKALKRLVDGRYCIQCKRILYLEKVEKIKNRQLSKLKGTKSYAISQIKGLAEQSCWASAHESCFRASFGINGESQAHRRKKFERWEHHRVLGRAVFCELRLKNGKGRPDLIIIDKAGNIFVEEIVCTEKEESLIKKEHKYPWEIRIIYVSNIDK